MANPQLENGHLRIANEVWDALCRVRIPAQARQVLDVIVRKTYGFNKKTDIISLSQFVDATGLHKPNVVRAIHKLIDMNLISRNGTARKSSYSFNKDHESWVSLSEQIKLSKQITEIISSDNKTLSDQIPTKDIKDKKDMSQLESYDERALSLSDLLRDRILKNKPDRKNPNVKGQSWYENAAGAIDKMLRIDKRDPNRIREVIEFCQADNEPRNGNFCWAKNILSGKKLRKQFDRLEEDMGDVRANAAPRGRFGR